MTPTVHILATCLNPDLIDNTTLVFKTIRTGFPTADILVWMNGLSGHVADEVWQACEKVEALGRGQAQMAHGVWIEHLLKNPFWIDEDPFWICDTDVIFAEKVEDWEFHAVPFAGRFEPEFFDPFSQTRHVARLHPSLMWFDPECLNESIRKWPGRHPFFRTVEKNLIRWHWVPENGAISFYDTCAGLHHAFGGRKFTDEQNRAYSHLHCGTYSDLQPNERLRSVHRVVKEEPRAASLLLEAQKKWYEEAAC